MLITGAEVQLTEPDRRSADATNVACPACAIGFDRQSFVDSHRTMELMQVERALDEASAKRSGQHSGVDAEQVPGSVCCPCAAELDPALRCVGAAGAKRMNRD